MNQILEAIVLTAAYYGRDISPDVLRMYADDLSDLRPESVIEAYTVYRRNPKNRTMPLPAQIREIIEPQVDDDTLAREAASRIVAAVPKFGYMQGQAAKSYVGELGWRVVDRYGGWQTVCRNLGDTLDVGTFQAQAREIARAQATLARAGRHNEPPSLPSPNIQMIAQPEPTKREFLAEKARELAGEIGRTNSEDAKRQLSEIMKAVKTIDGESAK